MGHSTFSRIPSVGCVDYGSPPSPSAIQSRRPDTGIWHSSLRYSAPTYLLHKKEECPLCFSPMNSFSSLQESTPDHLAFKRPVRKRLKKNRHYGKGELNQNQLIMSPDLPNSFLLI